MSKDIIIGYYPGCSLEGTAEEYDRSARACCQTLGIQLETIPDWSCCGASPAHCVDHVLSGALSARNLALASKAGMSAVATPCPNCLVNMRTAGRDLEDPETRKRINRLLDTPCEDSVEAISLLQLLVEKVGIEEITSRVTRPLAGLRVACYYGCIMNRPPELMNFDDPENPMAMDRVLEAAGAVAVPFPHKTECCGAAYGVPRKDLVMELSGRILDAAHELKADALVVACPLCQMNLDLRQGQVSAHKGVEYDVPVFYFTQLLGLALGLPDKDLGLNKLAVSPEKFLSKLEREG
ncbi:CoB--CoM heterodisulfide reductase iron-sulfur subunit B family protein [Desulfovibrio ferrophilus]|uniref:CoB--CoM heterodisulfide reductase n=1 Tax=Desulfovibrio ferrophilus TaxID=241368 RepID=A0A2Z6AW80_9BACT|nr:CoB--CoM heterodisulfide reductase iron-sulfur subunit B family protein [Desulfovibrio ferrophilus]BBD07481.1 CoB--CoM heterodisulfide reductase [Desulfovibrio ferrophilus]